MKNTPRKNTLAIKPRDEVRFWWYLLYRVAVTCVAVFVVGWLASAGSLLGEEEGEEGLSGADGAVDFHFSQGHSWGERMLTFRDAKLGGSRGQAHFSHVQVCDVVWCGVVCVVLCCVVLCGVIVVLCGVVLCCVVWCCVVWCCVVWCGVM
jgi:hypothetical protein